MDSSPERVVVIGASAGGVAALRQLAAGLPADFAAAVLMVLHIGANESLLPGLIASDCPLDVAHAVDGESLRPGTIRIAPPDRHLTLDEDVLRLTRSPKENFARPAIDPLFRSVALAKGTHAIGVILTGMLDDGTAGLQAVKQRGGIAIVQDPADAVEPSMPASALQHVAVDHCMPIAGMAGLLVRLASTPVESRTIDMSEPKRRLEHEQALSLGTGDYFEHLRAIGRPSPFTCPECHGGLWQVSDAVPRRYRCHTGHAFTERTLDLAVGLETDAALWNALRALHERASVLDQMTATSRAENRSAEAARYELASMTVQRQSRLLRELLEQSPEAGI